MPNHFTDLLLLEGAHSFTTWYIGIFKAFIHYGCILPPGLGVRDPFSTAVRKALAFQIIEASLAPVVAAIAICLSDLDDPSRLVRRSSTMYEGLTDDVEC